MTANVDVNREHDESLRKIAIDDDVEPAFVFKPSEVGGRRSEV